MSTDVYSEKLPDGNTTVQDYISWSDEEQEAYWNNYVAELKNQGLSDEEISEQVSEDQDSIEELISSCEEYVESLESLETGDTSDDEQITDWIETIEEIQEELEQATDLESDAVDLISSLALDCTDGSEVNIDDDSLELSGLTYEYSLGGSENPFDSTDSSSLTDEEYLLEEGVVDDNGVVITDVNADSILNYDDIVAAIENRATDALLTEQSIFISGDYHWELVSTSGDDYTFKVTDPNDSTKFSYVTFKDATNAVFYFGGNTISSSDIETIKTNWPTDLKNQCQWADTGETFTQLTSEEVEAEGAERYAVIDGYAECSEGISSSTVTQFLYSTSTTVQETASEALDLLFSYLDDPTQSSSDIWAQIYQLMAENGLSSEEQARVIQTLVIDVSINAPQHFETFFGAVVTTLEGTLNYDQNMGVTDKTCVILLETMTSVGGLYGGPSLFWQSTFATTESADGMWGDNEENVSAIAYYQSIMALSGSLVNASAATALANEQARIGMAAAVAEMTAINSAGADYVEELQEIAALATQGVVPNSQY